MQEQFSFSIEEEIYPEDSCLAMQVSNKHFSYCIYNPDDQKLLELKRYVFSNAEEKQLQQVITQNPRLQGSFYKIVTSLDFGFSSLLPATLNNGDAAPLMYLENADQQDHVITEVMEERQITNMYTVAPGILTWLVHNFPSSAYVHAHTVQIKAVEGAFEQGGLRVDVAEKTFTVQAFRNEDLLLSKTYSYKATADVAFYLLKICEVFGFSQEQVVVQLSGLIDVQSKLYRELYDYFLHISFKTASWLDTVTDLPAHYFTSLNELIGCELFQEA
ncbi:DUF3822 family protein [Niabella sp. W65]|nr:DUF3822 family protein [Niabella sp. W65]MCH7365896.1 DUF3822 family protein [Niabella sp. W65]ULT41648.1 DUF3822 family protein [Niabella sp. I65]